MESDRERAGAAATEPPATEFPVAAGILFGLGLGGFFDGIVLHQVLQWHHMVSSWYPVTSIENLERNTFWDGIFHSATYVFVVLGLFVLWRRGRGHPLTRPDRTLIGSLLIGWGSFNLVEGLIDHQWLGVHHVNERVDRASWLAWDLGFLAWGLAMLLAGLWLLRRAGRGRRGTAPGPVRA